MKISELSRVSGVPLPTVKFYLREGLLHPGSPLSRTQAEYDEGHVERLKLLRVLREVGDVPIHRLRSFIAVLETADQSAITVLAAAVDAINPQRETETEPHPAQTFADGLIAQAGWSSVRPDAPDRFRLAQLLEVVASFGTHEGRLDILQAYVEAADEIGRRDVNHVDDSRGIQALASEVVVGQVIFGEILLTLRRLAEEHHARLRFERQRPQG